VLIICETTLQIVIIFVHYFRELRNWKKEHKLSGKEVSDARGFISLEVEPVESNNISMKYEYKS